MKFASLPVVFLTFQMTTYPYTVPVIPGDLRRAELVKQAADTFEYLDAVSQDMFNRIATRLNVYRAQLNQFDERIQHANAHIDRIKGSKRAIQVHSSARYPVEQTRSTYKSIFECDPEHEETKPPVLHYNLFRLNETVDKFIDPNDKESKSNDDQLIILKQYEDNFIQKTKKHVLKGLGKPPTNIKSVLSFLTYNTEENPWVSLGRARERRRWWALDTLNRRRSIRWVSVVENRDKRMKPSQPRTISSCSMERMDVADWHSRYWWNIDASILFPEVWATVDQWLRLQSHAGSCPSTLLTGQFDWTGWLCHLRRWDDDGLEQNNRWHPLLLHSPFPCYPISAICLPRHRCSNHR